MKICILKDLRHSYSGTIEPKNEKERKVILENNKKDHFCYLQFQFWDPQMHDRAVLVCFSFLNYSSSLNPPGSGDHQYQEISSGPFPNQVLLLLKEVTLQLPIWQEMSCPMSPPPLKRL